MKILTLLLSALFLVPTLHAMVYDESDLHVQPTLQLLVRNQTKSFLNTPNGILQSKVSDQQLSISLAQGVIPGDTQAFESKTIPGEYQLFFTPQSTNREDVISCTGIFSIASNTPSKIVMVTVYEQPGNEMKSKIACRVEQQLALKN